MASMSRIKTQYPGVYFIEGEGTNGKPEKIYYIRYRRAGKLIEEKVGRQFQDDMTPARAAQRRAERISGKELSNNAKREAEKAAQLAADNCWTFNRLWKEYESSRPDSKSLYVDKNRYDKHLAPLFGEREPSDLSTLEVAHLRSDLLKTKSAQTAKHVLALLKRLINFGVSHGLCDPPNPKVMTIKLPKVDNESTEDLTPEQLQKLFEAIAEETNIQAANFMRMALFTGMRRGELFKLKWEHIDFERGFINILEPKGGKSQKIPLSVPARQLLLSHPRTEESEFVFPGANGGMRATIQVCTNKIKQKAGLPKNFRPVHGLRHVYASMLASSGQVDIYTLQKLLTHKSPRMTQRYAHLRDEAMQNASKVAGDIMNALINTQTTER